MQLLYLNKARVLIRRHCSTIRRLNLAQGGHFILNITNLATCNVGIKAAWIDHGELSVQDDSSYSIIEHEDIHHTLVTVSALSASASKVIEVTVPEICNITLNANDIDLSLKNKVFKREKKIYSYAKFRHRY